LTKKSKNPPFVTVDLETAFHNFLVEVITKFTKEHSFDGIYVVRGLLDVALRTVMAQKFENAIKLDIIEGLLLRICDFKYKNYREAIDDNPPSLNENAPPSDVIH